MLPGSPIRWALVVAAGICLAPTTHAAEPEVIDLWPGAVPGEKGDIPAEKSTPTKDGKGIASLTNVSRPTLTIYRPARDHNNGMAVVVCPGGGYTNLAWDHEGHQVGTWLSSIGATAVVLKYRVPRRPNWPRDQPPPQALQDAQRALSYVRSKAADWGVDSDRIGILGFSAGGHLGAWASTNFDKRSYETIDEVDRVSCRPDFAVLIYPGGVVKQGEMAPEITITKNTPPLFLVHATDDRSENSVHLYLAMKKLNLPAELHIYSTGGHGFGMRPSDKPYGSWTKRCEEWMKVNGFLKP